MLLTPIDTLSYVLMMLYTFNVILRAFAVKGKRILFLSFNVVNAGVKEIGVELPPCFGFVEQTFYDCLYED